MLEVWIVRILFLVFVGIFVWQMAARVRLIARASNNFNVEHVGSRLRRFLLDVVFQVRVIRERPLVGVMHAFVFWGFVAFAGFTTTEFVRGLGIVDLTGTRAFHLYSLVVVPFAIAVLVGIIYLLIR